LLAANSPFFFLFKTEVIKVNVKRPELNSPFYIYSFTNPSNAATNTLHNGYHVEVKDVDACWMIGDVPAISAWQVLGSEIMVEMPSMNYDYLKDEKVVNDARDKVGYKISS
jgi:hypothetical protein